MNNSNNLISDVSSGHCRGLPWRLYFIAHSCANSFWPAEFSCLTSPLIGFGLYSLRQCGLKKKKKRKPLRESCIVFSRLQVNKYTLLIGDSRDPGAFDKNYALYIHEIKSLLWHIYQYQCSNYNLSIIPKHLL